MVTVSNRRKASNYPFLIGMGLSLAAIALLLACREITDITRFTQSFRQDQHKRLGLPFTPGSTKCRRVPKYSVIDLIFRRVNPAELN